MSGAGAPAPKTRAQNQKQLWEEKQRRAREQGPHAVAAVWFDAIRMLAKQKPELWPSLAALLKDFYDRHA
jgi:hypothetical protein